METWAIVVAGGRGTRFGAPKQYALLAGRPVLAWALDSAREACDGVVLVLPAHDVAATAEVAKTADGPDPAGVPEMSGTRGTPGEAKWDADIVVAGGETRSESVRAGLAAVPGGAEIIAVHDGARPLARAAVWQAVIEAVANGADAAVPAAPVTDTVKRVTKDGHLETLDRASLVAVATPQAFAAGILRRAHQARLDATDDAALAEAIGARVIVVSSPVDNLKITTAADLRVAQAFIDVERAR